MPPNDSPYTAPAPQVPRPAAPPPPDPGPGQPVASPAPAAPDGTPSAASPAPPPGPDFQAALESALGPIRAELAAFRQENADLRANTPAPKGPQAGAGGVEEDWTQSLLADPRTAVAGVVKDVLSDMAPFFNELSGTAHEAILEGHRAAVDSEFGTGAFQDEIMPLLAKRIDLARKENPALLASREWLAREVDGIKGFKFNSFTERRAKAATARTEAEKAEAERLFSHLNATNLVGGVRAGVDGKPREPTAAEQAYLDSVEKAGTPLDLETLRKSQASGNLAELQAAFGPKEGE